jgi:hypothetical protein
VSDETPVGAGRIAGSNNLQHSIDANTRAVQSQAGVLSRVAQGLSTMTRNSGGTGTIRSQGMSGGIANGGGASFGSLGGILRMGGGVASGGGFPRIGGGLGYAGVAADVASSYGDMHMANQAMRDYNANLFGSGPFRSTNGGYRGALYGMSYNKNYGQGTADMQSAQWTLGWASNQQVGSNRWNAIQQSVGSFGTIARWRSASDIAATQARLNSAQGYYQMSQFGIRTDVRGQQQSMGQINNQILARSGVSLGGMNQAQIKATFSDNSALAGNYARMGFSQDDIRMFMQNNAAKAQAMSKGMSASEYDKNVAAMANNDSGARKRLEGAIGKSMVDSIGSRQTSAENQQVQQTQAFANATIAATDAVKKFSDMLNVVLAKSGLSMLMGGGAGGSSVLDSALGMGNQLSGLGGSRMMSKIPGVGRLLGRFGGIAGEAEQGAGLLGRLGGLGKFAGVGGKLLRGASIAGWASLAGGAIGGMISDGHGGARDKWGHALSGAATGAGIGAAAGSFIPGVGTAIGAGIGGLIGAGWSLFGGGKGGPSTGQAAGGGQGSGTIRSAGDAVSWAEQEAYHPSQNYFDMCDYFVASCFGLSASGYASAKAHWNNIPNKMKHTDRNPPAGAMVFWDIGSYGHIALSVGGGKVASTDIMERGKVSVVPLGTIEKKWRAKYLGWAPPYYQGRTGSVGGNAGSSGASVNGSLAATTIGSAGATAAGGYSDLGGNSEAAIIAAALGRSASGTRSGVSAGTGSPSGGRTSGGQAAAGGAPGKAPTGTLASWINQALSDMGMSGAGNAAILNTIIKHESGGNPRAINNWDSNAKAGHPSEGLMQVIGPTFKAHMMSGHGDIWNPVDNIIAGTRYALGRYHSLNNVPGIVSLRNGGKYVGYKDGAWRIGEDQVAPIHKGEMVLDARSAETVRQALMRDTHGSASGGKGGGSGAVLVFKEGSVVIHARGTSDDDMRQAAKVFAENVANDNRIKQLQDGF